jgi:hypothetical protein
MDYTLQFSKFPLLRARNDRRFKKCGHPDIRYNCNHSRVALSPMAKGFAGAAAGFIRGKLRQSGAGATVYNQDMENGEFFTDAFTAAIIAAGARARLETLQAGVPVFYWDRKQNLEVMEQPDGRKFEICFIAGAPRESNYRVIRELDQTAA